MTNGNYKKTMDKDSPKADKLKNYDIEATMKADKFSKMDRLK